MKTMILIFIQCVLNVYLMCIQALVANTSHFRKTKDSNNGGAVVPQTEWSYEATTKDVDDKVLILCSQVQIVRQTGSTEQRLV